MCTPLARFETIADALAEHASDGIDRRVQTGGQDEGGIGGPCHGGGRVVIDCKDTIRTELGTCATKADVECGNDDALVIHKRRGHCDTGATVPADGGQ